jgi:hypothetical protein
MLPESPMKMEAGERHFRHRVLAADAGPESGEQHRRDDESDARAQAIHVVEEIERVGEPHHPHHRQHAVEQARFEPVQAEAEIHQRGRGGDLPDQLGGRPQEHDVVDQPDHEHRHRRQQHRGQRHRQARHQRGDERGEADRDAAEKRHDGAVPAIGAGPGDHVNANRKDARRRHESDRERKGDEQRLDEGLQAGVGHHRPGTGGTSGGSTRSRKKLNSAWAFTTFELPRECPPAAGICEGR